MIDLAFPGDIFFYVPNDVFDSPPEFREGIDFYYGSEVSVDTLKECIELFNSEIEWVDMWNVRDGIERINNGHVFSSISDSEGILGYMWHYKNYTYNFFVSKRRRNRDVLDFVNRNRYLQTQNNHPFEYIYISDHNVHVQNLFKKRFQARIVTRKEVQDFLLND